MKSIDARTMQQRLYEVLKMNIKLAKSNDELSAITSETFDNFEEVTKNIDSYDQKDYEQQIAKLFFKTETLEEEKERLEKLVNLISKRVDQRKKIMVDYSDVTGKKLIGLESIIEESNIDDYKKRLLFINEYLDNSKNIEIIEKELNELNVELEEAYLQKTKDEEKNYDLEDDLLIKFKNILSNDESYASILEVIDVDYELEKVEPQVAETKRTLDTFVKAFKNLKYAGISSDTESSYFTYVEDAKNSYYQIKEKEYLLKIYKEVLDCKNIYNDLFLKRESIDKILDERSILRKTINIHISDMLIEFYDIINEQKVYIRNEKNNIDKINKILEKIKFKETKLENYKEDNKKVEILSLLEEYNLIETYSDSSVELPEEKELPLSFSDIESTELEEKEIAEEIIPKKINPYAIRSVRQAPSSLDVNFVVNKTATVMRRVGKALGIVSNTTSKPEVKEEKENYANEVTEEQKQEDFNLADDSNIVLDNQVKDNEVKISELEPVKDNIIQNEDNFSDVTNVKVDLETNVSPLKVEEVNSIFVPEENTKPFVVSEVTEEVKDSSSQEKNNNYNVPVFTSNTSVNETTTNSSQGLFWPESTPKFDNDKVIPINEEEKIVSMEHPFPTQSNLEFNPQMLNKVNDDNLPNLPAGSISLTATQNPVKVKKVA